MLNYACTHTFIYIIGPIFVFSPPTNLITHRATQGTVIRRYGDLSPLHSSCALQFDFEDVHDVIWEQIVYFLFFLLFWPVTLRNNTMYVMPVSCFCVDNVLYFIWIWIAVLCQSTEQLCMPYPVWALNRLVIQQLAAGATGISSAEKQPNKI